MEVMIAVGILSVVIGVVTVFVQNSNDQLLLKTAKMEQARLSRTIKAELQNVKNIAKSAALAASGNELALKRCMLANTLNTSDCTVTSAASQLDFSYFGKQSGTPNVQKTGAAVNYSLFGVRNCSLSTPFCPFWTVETFFWATCPGGATTCDQAANINVRYIVKPVRTTLHGLPLAAIPNLTDFNADKTKFAISHNVRSGRNPIGENQDCPVGAIMAGLDPNGHINCLCKAGFINTELNPNNPPICSPLPMTCLPGQRIKGRKADGSVLCVNQKVVCPPTIPWVDLATNDGDITNTDKAATCKLGGWLEAIDLGVCRPGVGNKKGTSRGIKCDNNKGKCCYYEEY